jgi:hypothetical protein
MIRDVYAAALRSLEAAPALLARIEAGEGLLREARERLNLADRGNTARRIEVRIDAFLAAKEANRGN